MYGHFSQMPTAATHFYQQRQLNQLHVFAEGTVKIQPDTAIVTLGVQTENEEVQIAQSENAVRTNQIIQMLTDMGISQPDIQTADYRIDVLYDFENGNQQLRGYRVMHLLQVTVKQIDNVGEIIDTSVQGGANIVSNVQFVLRQPEIAYNQALSLALNNAQQKARIIAATLHVNINETPVHIEESNQISPPTPFQTALFAKSETATPMMPGQLEITARITAQFEYFHT